MFEGEITETFGATTEELQDDQETQEQAQAQAQAQIWGIKTPQIQLREAQRLQEVTERTLRIMQRDAKETLVQGRKAEIERVKGRMEQYIRKFNEQSQQIVQFMVETGRSVAEVAEGNYQSDKKMDEYQDTVDKLASIIEAKNKAEDKHDSRDKEEKTKDFKTPKIQLRRYGGDPLKWTEFWEQYRYAVHDRNIQPSAKMVQLRELLVGRAAAVIRGLPLSDANYKIAIEKLMREFGDESHLRSAHIKAIPDIQAVNNASNLMTLRRFYEDVATNYAALESLGFATHVMCWWKKLCSNCQESYDLKSQKMTHSGHDGRFNNCRKGCGGI